MDGRHPRLIQVHRRGQGHVLVRVHCLALVLAPTLARILAVSALVLAHLPDPSLVLAPHLRPPPLVRPAPAVAAPLLPAKVLLRQQRELVVLHHRLKKLHHLGNLRQFWSLRYFMLTSSQGT